MWSMQMLMGNHPIQNSANVLLVLLAAGAVIASILVRKQRVKSLYDEYEDYEEEELPPPRPHGLDDVDQEE